MLDWFLREGGYVISWWLLATLAGVAVLPLCTRMLSGLADKGYIFSRTIGILLVGYVYWLLVSFGLLQNTTGGMVLAWLLVAVLAGVVYSRMRDEFDLRTWWAENRKVVIVAEILFAVLLFGWAIYRAHQNGLSGTEKPMELAFISAIMRSNTFPPSDPWLAGYAISYYHFGYVMSAMFSMLSGATSSIGFNLTNALLFALTGLNAFGIVYNMVRSQSSRIRPAIVTGILGAVFIVLMGNFQLPLIELPYQTQSASESYLEFWGSQQRVDYGDVEAVPQSFDLNNWSFWWWFRASRVLTDYNLDDSLGGVQPIDEFPQFSFLLADNHPHVLALPFAVMTLGLALSILMRQRPPNRYEIVFYGLVIGGLIFLNTWDGPLYLFALLGAEALRRVMQEGKGRLQLGDWTALLVMGLFVLGIAIIAYLPFLIGFRSQAAGVVPNIVTLTLFRRYFIMFAPFILILAVFLGIESWRGRHAKQMNWLLGFKVAGGIVLALIVTLLAVVALAAVIPSFRSIAMDFIDQNGGWSQLIGAVLARRLEYIVTTLVMLIVIVLVVARMFPLDIVSTATRSEFVYSKATGFALLLVAMGAVLTLVPEFIYLRDNFGSRINTIFKFYYQVWIVFGLASAYAAYSILHMTHSRQVSSWVRYGFAGVLVVVLFLGLMYPIFGVYTRAFVETGRAGSISPSPLSLEGDRTLISQADYDVVRCLDSLVDGNDAVVVEAVRDSYNASYGRVGTLTGIPILLGWENHERQWRGATYDETAGTRRSDIDTLYTDLRWDVASRIISQYGIDYVMYGDTEINQYGAAGEEKFVDNAELVCASGASHLYRINSDQLVNNSTQS